MFQTQFSILSFLIKFIIYSAILVFFLLFSPFLQDFKPKEYSFQLPFDFTGVLSKNELLDKSQKIFEQQVKGPESLAIYKGWMYTGTLDGRIVRLSLNDNKVETITTLNDACVSKEAQENPNLSLCGRPLGLRFNERGSLFVVDAYFGLWRIENAYDFPKTEVIKSNILPLRDLKIGCRDSMLVDDLVIDGNTVYISDVSGKWNLENYFYILSEPETNGRIIKYDMNSKKAEIILDQLWAPKGVELTEDKEALLICESIKRRIIKYYIRGTKAGKTEIFSESLPGEPENIRRGADKSIETYWITISSARTIRDPSTWDYLSEYPTIRLFAVRLLYAVGALIEFIGNTFALQSLRDSGVSIKNGNNLIVEYTMRRYTVVAELDYQGLIVATYHSSSINDLSEAREVRQSGNRYIYMGSNSNDFIAKLMIENNTKISDKLRHRKH